MIECKTCGNLMSETEFTPNKARKNGYEYHCKKCIKLRRNVIYVSRVKKDIPNIPGEVWMPVKIMDGIFQEFYMASNLGRIKSIDRVVNTKIDGHNGIRNSYGRVLKQTKDKHKEDIKFYKIVVLTNGIVRHKIGVHRIILSSFQCTDSVRTKVNHIDGNTENNILSNLEWVTHQENMDHAVSHKLHSFGENHGMHKLTEKQVLEILYKKKNQNNTGRKLAKLYNVTPSTISAIYTGNSWRYISKKIDISV